MKIERWNNHDIRFVQNNGERVGISKYKGTQKVSTLGGTTGYILIKAKEGRK